MFQMIRNLFPSKYEERDFEILITRVPKFLQREDIIRSETLAVEHQKVKPSIRELPFFERLGVMPLGFANFGPLNRSFDNLDM